MKIVFLCGCLEPNSDGVGDYTRKLAVELIKHGHEIAAISLNDKKIDTDLEEMQKLGDVGLQVYRIPLGYSNHRSLSLATTWVRLFNPEWISLQYVPYSFNKKGLPFHLAYNLQKLAKGVQWHVMFHELWVGFTRISPIRHKVIGYFQKLIVELLIRRLSPGMVTTTNRLYQLLLLDSGISATILPLFSNISVAPLDNSFTSTVLEKLCIHEEDFPNWRLIGIFGNLYPQAKLEETIKREADTAETNNQNLAFIGFGRTNLSGITEFKRLEKIFLNRVKFLHLGEQPAEKVSNLLKMLHAGVSCTPAQHIAKSGVFAAMKLHGLEVILPNEDIIPEYDVEIKKYRQKLLEMPAHSWDVSFVSKQFSALMKSN